MARIQYGTTPDVAKCRKWYSRGCLEGGQNRTLSRASPWLGSRRLVVCGCVVDASMQKVQYARLAGESLSRALATTTALRPRPKARRPRAPPPAAAQALALSGPLLRAPLPMTLVAQRAAVHTAMMVAFPGFGSSGASDSGPSEEVLAAYRLMGLGEDADYDEIEAAFDSLSAAAEGDTKKKIKLQVAKDRIFDNRLRQRMSGAFKGTAPINPFEREEGPKPLIKIPVFLADVMELPTKEKLFQNLAIFTLIGLLPALSKSWASTSITLGFGVGLFTLYNRGVPESSSEMGAEMRPPKARATTSCATAHAHRLRAVDRCRPPPHATSTRTHFTRDTPH